MQLFYLPAVGFHFGLAANASCCFVSSSSPSPRLYAEPRPAYSLSCLLGRYKAQAAEHCSPYLKQSCSKVFHQRNAGSPWPRLRLALSLRPSLALPLAVG